MVLSAINAQTGTYVSKLFVLPDNFPGRNKATFTADGLHPNREGYVALTDYILNQEIK